MEQVFILRNARGGVEFGETVERHVSQLGESFLEGRYLTLWVWYTLRKEKISRLINIYYKTKKFCDIILCYGRTSRL